MEGRTKVMVASPVITLVTGMVVVLMAAVTVAVVEMGTVMAVVAVRTVMAVIVAMVMMVMVIDRGAGRGDSGDSDDGSNGGDGGGRMTGTMGMVVTRAVMQVTTAISDGDRGDPVHSNTGECPDPAF